MLIGGSNQTISLQPLSIEGNTGLNVAAGIGAITLRYQRQMAPDAPLRKMVALREAGLPASGTGSLIGHPRVILMSK